MSIAILLVSDKRDDAEKVRSLLAEHTGFTWELTLANSSIQAIELAQSQQFALVLLTSDLSQKAVLHSFLRLKSKLKQIPIVVVADLSEDKPTSSIVQRYAQGYLPRSTLQSEDLVSVLNNALHFRRPPTISFDSSMQFRSLFENTNDAVLLCDIDSSILAVNERCIELLGYPANELIGRDIAELVAGYERDVTYQTLLKVLMGRSLPAFKCTFVPKSGCEIDTEMKSVLVFDELENPLYYQVFLRDMRAYMVARTEIKAQRDLFSQHLQERIAELQLVNDELSRIARAKDQFIATVSHELRTPLSAVLNLSEAVQEGVYGPLNARQIEMMGKIEQSGRHLLSLLNDILDISRIETRGIELNWEDVYIDEVCRNSLLLVQETARSRGVQLESSIMLPGAMLIADERRLTQILINLLGNAIKFTPKGGSVGLEIREGKAHFQNGNHLLGKDKRMIEFVVWDTGIGIAAEDIAKLFQPFVQILNPHSNQNVGSGLGLVLVDRLVRLHEGTLSVESEVGKGSKFIVSLPWQTHRTAYEISNADESTTLWTVV